MFRITMEGTEYQFNFNIRFMRSINKKASVPVDGIPNVKRDVGLQYVVARVVDGDVDALIDVLVAGNSGFDPRLTEEVVERYIDDEATNIDDLFGMVIDFLSKSNATKTVTKNLLKAIEEAEQ